MLQQQRFLTVAYDMLLTRLKMIHSSVECSVCKRGFSVDEGSKSNVTNGRRRLLVRVASGIDK